MNESETAEFRLMWCVVHAVLITGVLMVLTIVNL